MSQDEKPNRDEEPRVLARKDDGPETVAKAGSERTAGAKAIAFSGMIHRMPFRLVGNWQIASRIVAVTPRTIIQGTPGVGYEAEVDALEALDGGITATKLAIKHPELNSVAPWAYLRNLFGLVSVLSLLFPLALPFMPFMPFNSIRATFMIEIICLLLFAFIYMDKKSMYRARLVKSVRGAAGGIDRMLVAYLALILSVGIGFLALLGLLEVLQESLVGFLARLVILPLEIGVFGGATLSFSILGVLSYMEDLEEMGAWHRPLYLKPTVDLVSLGMQAAEENLAIPSHVEWKITERKRQTDGGVWFVVSWLEETTRRTQSGESDKVIREKEYEVTLSVSGAIISLKERK